MSCIPRVDGVDTSDAAFIAAMREVVAADPDRVYEPQTYACAYVHKDTDGNLCDGCLFGTILVRMGVPREWFIDNAMNTQTNASQVLSELGFNESIATAADDAQTTQDTGSNWSYAEEFFLKTYQYLKSNV